MVEVESAEAVGGAENFGFFAEVEMKLSELRVRSVRPGLRVAPPRVRVFRKPGNRVIPFHKHQIPVDWDGVKCDRARAKELGGEYLAAFQRWERQQA